jgi:hypothetical protein
MNCLFVARGSLFGDWAQFARGMGVVELVLRVLVGAAGGCALFWMACEFLTWCFRNTSWQRYQPCGPAQGVGLYGSVLTAVVIALLVCKLLEAAHCE